MALTVTTPADSNHLTTLEVVVDELGLTNDDDHQLLEEMIQQASDAAESYCARVFAKQTYQETVRANGGPHLLLAQWPVVSVSQILNDGSPVTDFTLQEPEEGILYRKKGWGWSTRFAQGSLSPLSPNPYPNSEEATYTVDYIAGYALLDALIPNLPGDVQRAAIITVKDWYLNRSRNPSLTEKAGPASSRFKYSADHDLHPAAARLLGRYRDSR